MRKHVRPAVMAGAMLCSIATAAIVVTPALAMAQQPAPSAYATDIIGRYAAVDERFNVAKGDEKIGESKGNKAWRSNVRPCDPVTMRAAFAEMEALAREAHGVAAAARAAGEFATVDAQEAANIDEFLQGVLRNYRFYLDQCDKHTRASIGGGDGSPAPANPAAVPDAPAPATGRTSGAPATQQNPPSNPFPPGFRMYQALDSLSALLDHGIKYCDRAAFDKDRQALLAEIDRYSQLEQLTDQDRTSLRVRRQQAEAMQFPQPCPPAASASTPVTQPSVVVKSEPGVALTTPASPPTLLDRARTALIAHAEAVGACDQVKMTSNLFLLDALVEQALRESMELTGSPFTAEEERRKAVLAEIMGHRDEARKRQADCPKDLRIGLNPQEQMFLDIHNAERRLVGSPPLQWDPGLAAGAKAYAIQLTGAGQLVHSSREGRKDIRENLLQSLPGRSPQQMIGVWIDEKRYFKPGLFPDVSTTGDWYDVGHYTQMIWETNSRVGCAVHGDLRFSWFVCHYSPGGNKDGKPVVTVPVPPPM